MSRPTKHPVEKQSLLFRDTGEWAAWLERNHAVSGGVWLRLAKKASGFTTVTQDQAVEVALCYGWIDGESKSDGEDYWLLKFTPRGSRSIWSRLNREKAAALMTAGRLKPAGLEQVERAMKDGRWEAAYDPPSTVVVPPDFEAALSENAAAKTFFKTLTGQNRYAILFRIQSAGTPGTRARRIAKFVAMLARHETIYS